MLPFKFNRALRNHWLLVLFLLLISCTFSYGQQSNLSKAETAYQSFRNAFAAQELKMSATALSEARAAVDLAAENTETNEAALTWFLKGDIYFFVFLLKAVDASLLPQLPTPSLEVPVASLKKAYGLSTQYQQAIEQSVAEKQQLLEQMAAEQYQNKQYRPAMELYADKVQMATAINKTDSVAIYYTAYCAELLGEWEIAANYYRACADLGFGKPDVYMKLVNALMMTQKNEESLAFLQQVLAREPGSKALHYALGTLYMEAGKQQEAIQQLRQALQIDPNYSEAQLQLGTFLHNIAQAKSEKAQSLPLVGYDAEATKLKEESLDYYRQSIAPLESYLKAHAGNSNVLSALVKAHRVLGNMDRVREYQTRLGDL